MISQEQVERDKTAWLKARMSGIAASEIAAVMNLAPKEHGSAFALFAAKQTGDDSVGDNDAMVRGRHLEPYVSDVYEGLHPELVVMPGGLYHAEDRPWQMATFDRLAVDPKQAGMPELFLRDVFGPAVTTVRGYWPSRTIMPVQIKTANGYEGWGEPGSADVPDHYRAQCLQEMDVADAEAVILPVLFMQKWEVVTYVINRDADAEADMLYMREAAEEFLDRLKRDDPPPVDWTPATTRALKTMHPSVNGGSVEIPKALARKYRDARRAMEHAEKRLGACSNEILALMGEAEYAVTGTRSNSKRDVGVVVAKRLVFPVTRVDTKALRAKRPKIAKQFAVTKDTIQLRASTWAKTHIEGERYK